MNSAAGAALRGAGMRARPQRHRRFQLIAGTKMRWLNVPSHWAENPIRLSAKYSVELVAVGHRWPRSLVLLKGGESCVYCDRNFSFIELSGLVHFLAENLDDSLAFLETTANKTIYFAQDFGVQWHRDSLRVLTSASRARAFRASSLERVAPLPVAQAAGQVASNTGRFANRREVA
jgi:hypothetical protein